MEKAGVVICGGGPAGMTSAISLARNGFSNIVVLERLPESWDPDWVKSSCYRLDFHSLKWFNLMGLMDELKESSVLYDYSTLMVYSDNTRKMVPRADRVFYNDTYFISRSEMLQFFLDMIVKVPDLKGKIEMRFNTSVNAVERNSDGQDGFIITAGPANGTPYKLTTPLVIGASGARTQVHQVMKEIMPRFHKNPVPYLNVGKRRKAMRLKVPADILPGKQYVTCIAKDGGFLVVFPAHAEKFRSATCLFKKIDFKDGDEFFDYLYDNFPWMPWRDVLEKDLAESFATHPGRFTSPVEYVSHLQVAAGSNGGACVVGDAVHVAPPCLAQGINSAINDVASLHEAFAEGKKNGRSIPEMLKSYEKAHLRSAQAISKLMPKGYPYQYPGSANTLHKRMWFWDYNMRNRMHKLCPALFYAPVIKLLQDPSLTYADVLDRHHATTRNFVVSCAVAAAGVAAVGSLCVGQALKHMRDRSSA